MPDSHPSTAPSYSPFTPPTAVEAEQSKEKPRQWWRWRNLSPSDRLQTITISIRVGAFAIALGALFAVRNQLRVNDQTQRTAIRGQLYQGEAGMLQEEAGSADHVLNTLWTLVPETVGPADYGPTLMRLITSDRNAIAAKSASELHWAISGLEVFSDSSRRNTTSNLRRLFLYAQANLYHTHNAHDYHLDGVLKDGEWDTWRGYIREMHAHPVLMATIYHGYTNRYFSQDFGEFLLGELCGRAASPGRGPEILSASMQRDCDFARSFYPEMFQPGWTSQLAAY